MNTSQLDAVARAALHTRILDSRGLALVAVLCAGCADAPGAVPALEAPPASSPFVYVDIAGRDGLLCGAASDDAIRCWRGGAESIVAGTSGPTRVALGEAYGCAIRLDGAVACFETADGSTATTARDIPAAGPAIDVAAGRDHGCMLDREGVVRCFALDTGEQVGPSIADALDVAMVDNRVCVLSRSGATRCTDVTSGLASPHEIGGALELSSAPGRVVAIRGDGSVVEIGATDETRPQVIGIVPDGVGVAASADLTCVRRGDHSVLCWRAGEEPSLVAPLAGASTLAVGGAVACALLGGAIRCETVVSPG